MRCVRIRAASLSAAALWVAGCSCSPAARAGSEEPLAAGRADAPAPSVEPPSQGATAAGGAALRGRPSPAREVAIVVENGTTGPLRLRRALALEREQGGSWAAQEEVSALWLRADCRPVSGVIFWSGGGEECVEIPPGGILELAPWSGEFGDAQCACEECYPAPAGRYRFVARRCDGGRLEGEPFELP